MSDTPSLFSNSMNSIPTFDQQNNSILETTQQTNNSNIESPNNTTRTTPTIINSISQPIIPITPNIQQILQPGSNYSSNTNNTNNNNNNSNILPITSNGNSPLISSPNNNSSNVSSPYKKPLSLTKDKIPTHLQHYLDSVATFDFDPNNQGTIHESSDSENGEDIREVTPATITLRSLNQNTNNNINNNNNNNISNNNSVQYPNVTTTTTTTSNSTTPPTPRQRKRKSSINSSSQDDSNGVTSNALATIPGSSNNANANGGDMLSLANVMNEDRSLSRGGQSYIEITEYLNFPQSDAAKKLGIPTSTLSKRWKEAARGRKWPYRKVSKIDKEIMTLLHNIPAGTPNPDLPPEVDASLVALLKKRQEKLKPVFIRM
ncbi:hypothetical protein DLAC_05153 [Tieghemostelium lacteum]|uniref:RWP-RK domain-containing protein n=1 Tax=Tieghemostelium lacteum TaxID=361077 RepID=A0A151ZIG8_TIELA|nr:hypothetical protein DLAC_05153 [Tieghemostelium lacteum]|eukprot:KYQ93763.1 hypothetical protein DLAC_05153 [Tieghemostelium lacteum]